MNAAVIFGRTVGRELLIAVLTGLITFVLSGFLAPVGLGAAVAFALVAATVAGALDTLYFHLLFSLRRAPAFAAEQSYQQTLADTRRRLQDGSMRLREALIRRFEADYRRTAAITRPEGKSRRQIQEAKRRRKARLWIVERALSAAQLLAATAEAKTDAQALERWSELVDGMVDVSWQLRQRLHPGAALLARFHPDGLVTQVQTEWAKLAASVPGTESRTNFPLPSSAAPSRRIASLSRSPDGPFPA